MPEPEMTAKELLAFVGIVLYASLSSAALATMICLTILLSGQFAIGILLSTALCFFGCFKAVLDII